MELTVPGIAHTRGITTADTDITIGTTAGIMGTILVMAMDIIPLATTDMVTVGVAPFTTADRFSRQD